MSRLISFLTAGLLISATSVAASASQVVEVENKAYFLCKNGKQARTIRVQVADGQCNTYYSKDGSEKSIGNGKNVDSCVNIMNNVKANLEKSSWACRDISATRITASAEAQ